MCGSFGYEASHSERPGVEFSTGCGADNICSLF